MEEKPSDTGMVKAIESIEQPIKLFSLEQVREIIHTDSNYTMLEIRLAAALAQEMRENERLRQRVMIAVAGLKGHGDKYEAIGILDDALSNKPSDETIDESRPQHLWNDATVRHVAARQQAESS